MVLDVFCAESANTLHMFIVLKSARVHVWRFLRPSFEWSFLTKVELSVSRNVQVTSVCFDRKSKLLFWCERRTPTQCFVCKGRISMEGGKNMIVEKADILHNCPPVHLFLVGSSGVLLHPTANSPAGLTMYWSAALNRIQVHNVLFIRGILKLLLISLGLETKGEDVGKFMSRLSWSTSAMLLASFC